MSSKSVLLLGIVFVFLLNVVAVHNYINSYYYQPDKAIVKKDDFFNIDILKNLSKKLLGKEEDNNSKQSIIISEEEILEDNETEIKPEQEQVKKIIEHKEELINYKSHYSDQITNEKKSLEDLSENNITEENKTVQKVEEKKKDVLKEDKVKVETDKNEKIVKEEETVKKEEPEEVDNSEKSAYIVLNLNVKNNYANNNPIIQKIVKNLDDKKIIKIKIYKYSTKIKDYLEKIKNDFAEQGIDMDDIKVIYNKDENKKNKIKILLTKKD